MARLNSKLPTVSTTGGIGSIFSELRKVTWPSVDEALRLTILVLAVSIILGLFFGLVIDNIFTRIISAIANSG